MLACHFPYPSVTIQPTSQLLLPRQQLAPHGKHLPARDPGKPVHLPRILLDLPAPQQHLQPARLLRQLEQPRPLVLGQQRLLAGGPGRVLALALGLPRRDFGLLPGQAALVVLVVVELGVVRLDGLEQQVARLLQEGVEREVEVVEVRRQRLLRGRGRGRGELGEGRREAEGRPRGRGGDLVEERGEEVGVVDREGEFDEDVLVAEVGLLYAVGRLGQWRVPQSPYGERGVKGTFPW